MAVPFKAWIILAILSLTGVGCFISAEAVPKRDWEKIFEESDKAFVEGDFKRGTQELNDLIASHAGDFELATRALHRACLSEYLELIANDWPSSNFPRNLLGQAGGNYGKMWRLISEYLEEAFLEVGKFAGGNEIYEIPPPMVLESLWRRRGNFPLTPLDNLSDEPAERIMTLRRLGFVSDNDPAVIDASILLVFLRKHQKRFLEAYNLVDELVATKNQQIDWVLSQARLHAETRSPHAGALTRKLFARLEAPGANLNATTAKAANRAKRLNLPSIEKPVNVPVPAGEGWMGQMVPDLENRSWGRVAAGLVENIEAEIDLWIQDTFNPEQRRMFMVRSDDTGSAMTWNVLDEQLKSLGAEKLQKLRQLQEKRCSIDPRARNPDKAGQKDRLSLYRRFPWAQTAHRGLLLYARQELESGRGQSAYSGFSDLLEHANDPDLLKRARVGLWLATAQLGRTDELSRLIAETGEDRIFPWMDGEAQAGEIQKRILDGSPPPAIKVPATPLPDLQVQVLKMPARQLWPQMSYRSSPGLEFVDLQKVGSNILASTRNLLALYDANKDGGPAWTNLSGGQRSRSVGRPGRFRPIIRNGMIHTRWGYDADPSMLVGLDAGTRNILWSLDACGPREARRKIPLGNPVLSGGQIYVAAGWEGHHANGTGGFNLRLSSVDAASGTPVWHADLNLQWQDNFSHSNVFGDSLTVHEGKIYCSPGTGYIGRFDARDGRMEWLHNYASVRADLLQADTLGNAPLIMGDIVVCLPRDTNTMVGLDRRTGNVLWSSSTLLPRQIIGTSDGNVLIRGRLALGAVEIGSGRIRWRVPLLKKMLGRATLQGSSIYSADKENLYRHDAASGIEQEKRPLPKTRNTIRNVSIQERNLYLITDETVPDKKNPFASKTTGNAVWEITGTRPQLYHPKAGEPNRGILLVQQDEMMHCIEATPNGRVLWQRFLFPSPSDVYFLQEKAILVFHKGQYDLHLKALDLQNGDVAWELDLPRLRCGHGATYSRMGKYLFGRDNSDRFHLVDLNLGRVVLQNRIDRRNGFAKAGLANGKIQVFVTAYNRQLFWLSWDTATDDIEGSNQILKGVNGEPDKAFNNELNVDVKFGDHACYFISDHGNAYGQHMAYRGDYKDRSVRLIQRNAGKLHLAPPFLMLQEEQTEQNRKNNTRTWKIQRGDNPDYAHSLELANEWTGKPFVTDDRVVEVIPLKKDRNPFTLRIHDLNSRKTIVLQTDQEAEKMGAVLAGPDQILVYAYQRNKHNTKPYFRVTPYDLNSGKAGPTMEIDYWNGTNRHPDEIRVIGNLLFARNHDSLRAWHLKI